MSSEYMFGAGQGRVSAREWQRVDKIARKHGAAFCNPHLSGEGYRFWFSTLNRGHPFNEQTEARVMAEVGRVQTMARRVR